MRVTGTAYHQGWSTDERQCVVWRDPMPSSGSDSLTRSPGGAREYTISSRRFRLRKIPVTVTPGMHGAVRPVVFPCRGVDPSKEGSVSFGVHGFVRAVDRRAFIDSDVLDVEYDRVFYPSWQFLGFAKEVSEPGDYILRTLGRDEVVVVRGEDGEVRALHNSCTHRGTRLCRASLGNTAHLRCSYHGWTFANDGRLVGVPALRSAYPPDFDRTEHGLPTARVVCRMGVPVRHLGPQRARPGRLPRRHRLVPRRPPRLRSGEWEVCGPPQRVRTKGNWKIPTDNFMRRRIPHAHHPPDRARPGDLR